MTVCVMGLGNIGLAVALYASKYVSVIGYDISPKAIAVAINNGIKASDKVEAVDIYIIAVNTYYRNNAPDMSAIESCCSKIKEMNRNALVCFESTLCVGTSRQLSVKFGLRNMAVVPHRWWEEDQENHGVKQLRVIGALNKESMKKAMVFYQTLEIPLHQVSSLELAEASKIAENAHRYVQIAFVEELKLIAIKNNLNFEEWRSAINTKWNVDLPEARNGIGKECLPKDTAFLASLDPEAALLNGAMKANDNYIKRLTATEAIYSIKVPHSRVLVTKPIPKVKEKVLPKS
ncbi:MAG: hypothetical protein NWE93_00615 [Candidatus Bathyarchaeota archaeon]|nr:hypothetical protein [Candidatus Bathyarchaeota archaeon]